MKIPKNIKESIKIAGHHNAIANKHNTIIRNWLESKGYNVYDETGVFDYLIDSIEQTNDGSDALINFLEKL